MNLWLLIVALLIANAVMFAYVGRKELKRWWAKRRAEKNGTRELMGK